MLQVARLRERRRSGAATPPHRGTHDRAGHERQERQRGPEGSLPRLRLSGEPDPRRQRDRPGRHFRTQGRREPGEEPDGPRAKPRSASSTANVARPVARAVLHPGSPRGPRAGRSAPRPRAPPLEPTPELAPVPRRGQDPRRSPPTRACRAPSPVQAPSAHRRAQRGSGATATAPAGVTAVRRRPSRVEPPAHPGRDVPRVANGR